MLMQPQFKNILEDHFTLLQICFTFYYIFGTYAMLVVQIVSILFGGYGIYRYFTLSNTPRFALLAVIHFLTAWGIFSALAFDYHENVLGRHGCARGCFIFLKKKDGCLAQLVLLYRYDQQGKHGLMDGIYRIGIVA
jgi:hypothetical protein